MTIRESTVKILLRSEMPLKLGLLAKLVDNSRPVTRADSKGQYNPTKVNRMVSENPHIFFKFGPFISLKTFGPSNYEKFITYWRDKK